MTGLKAFTYQMCFIELLMSILNIDYRAAKKQTFEFFRLRLTDLNFCTVARNRCQHQKWLTSSLSVSLGTKHLTNAAHIVPPTS